ncbi:MAG: DUF433 domain-containing protein [Holophagales bacterium]|nr:DUF433 domain-containing protein [Holophagales bacterium]
MDYQSYIVRDPGICGGEPVIRGTRIPLRTVLASLAEGAAVAEILEDFPSSAPEGVRAAIAFEVASAPEDLPRAGLRVATWSLEHDTDVLDAVPGNPAPSRGPEAFPSNGGEHR